MSRITEKTPLWIVIVLAAGAFAAAAGAKEERIDVALKDASGQKVLQSFGQILEAKEVKIDPSIDGDLTITLNNARVTTVMDAACDALGCRWTFEDGVLEFAPDPDYTPPKKADDKAADPLGEPVNLELEDAPIRDVLGAFGRIADMKVKIDPAIQGTMSVQIHDKPAREALEQICKEHDFVCDVTVSGDEGSVLEVAPRTQP